MSAGLSLIQPLAPQQATGEPLTSVPSSASERMGAAWEASQTPDRYWNITAARRDRAAKIIDDYQAVTGEKLRNPFDNAPTMEEIRENPGQPTTAIYAKRLETLRQKATDLRSTMPDVADLPANYLNPDSIDSQIGRESRAARDRETNLMATGHGIPAFVASAGGEMASPHGVLSAFLPVSRMPLAAAERTIAGFTRNVGREALFQAGVNVAAQIPASVIDYNTRRATGTEQTPEQLVEEFVGAAVAGAILGGAFRGAHLTIRRLQGKGVELPPAVRDAALVVESRDLYGDKNALGLPAAAHEAALDRAVADVSRGRAADVADIIGDRAPRSESGAPIGPRSIWEERPTTQMPKPGEAPRDASATGEDSAAIPEGRAKEAPIPEGADAAAPDWLKENAAGAVEHANRLGLTEDVRRLAEGGNLTANQISEQLGGRLSPDEVRAVRDSLGIAPIGPTVMPGGSSISPEHQAALTKLAKMVDEPSAVTEPFTPPEKPGAGRPTGESPQDKAMQAQVKQLLDEGGGATPEHRRQYEAVLQQEKETRAALSCVGGGAL